MTRASNVLTRFAGLGFAGLALAAAAACNQPPEGPTISLEPTEPTTLDDVRVVMGTEASDPNDDQLFFTYAWEVKDAGSPGYRLREDIVGDLLPAEMTRKGQMWRVSVTVSDGDESTTVSTIEDTDAGTVAPDTSDPAVATVGIVNTPPEATYAKLSPTSGVDTFGILTASVGGEDIDGDDVSLDVVWYVNGTALEVEGNTLTGDMFGKNDEVWFEVVPNDGEADGEALASNKVVIDNTPPRLDGVVVTPEEIFEASTLACEAVGWYDADDDEPALDVVWMVNGAEVGTGPTLTGDKFDKHDLVRCVGRPNDGDSLGDAVVSPVVGVLNTAPTIGSVSLSESSPMASGTLGYTVNDAADADGDDLTYKVEWYVDGELVHEGQELPPRSFIKNQEIYAVVTPNDGENDGEPVKSEVVTSVNTPPTLRTVTLKPEALYTNSVAFPSVDAEDLDGDRITYTRLWYVNGSAVSHTGSTLDGELWFDKGDKVQVEITPSDDESDGPAVKSDEIEVLNSFPTVPEVAIDPEKPKSTDDLWCEVLEESTDADEEDDLVYTFTWTRNGSDFTDASDLDYEGDLVDVEWTADGDEFTCTLEVTDGTETVTATSTVTVQDWAGPRTFTNCGQSGYSGPSQSQCNSAYSGTPVLDDGLIVSSGIQQWTVPQDGVYRIEAYGAQGGRGQSYSWRYDGYEGARIRGDVRLSKGDKVNILVGQMGSNYFSYYSAGGGGGTFVATAGGSPLIVAGGGGGNGYNYYKPSGCHGNSGYYYGNGGSYSSGSCSRYYSSGPYGGSYYYGSSSYHGYGGAGFSYDGGYYYWYSYSRAYAYTRGGRGGNDSVDGGFGGGGGSGYFYGGGGGGGYHGGNGSRYRGGGGSSYNAGSNVSESSGARKGHGYVVIDLAP